MKIKTVWAAFFLVGFICEAAFGQAGQIKGKIVLSRPPAPLPPHTVTTSQSLCGLQIPNEALKFGKKLELENVVVFLANVKPDSLPPVVVTLEMAKCVFRPHVLAVLRGDSLLLRNADAVLHHARGYLHKFRPGWNLVTTRDIFAEETATAFNLAFPAPNSSAMEALQEPGLIEVRSESGHDWMKAYVLVMPHRFFAVSNAKGEFALEGLPTGKYDMILWHESLGLKRQLVAVTGKTTALTVMWEASPPAADSLATATADSVASQAPADTLAQKR